MTLQKARYGDHRPDAHLIGLHAGDGKALEDAQRLDAVFCCCLLAHHHAGGCAVGELRGIAGGDVFALRHLLATRMHGL